MEKSDVAKKYCVTQKGVVKKENAAVDVEHEPALLE
jgi:hypothetical protein